MSRPLFAAFVVFAVGAAALAADPPRNFSGIYPNLAYSNSEGECGTGAVVPWAGRLWVITYGPHLPRGSSDKLYEIDDALRMTIRPESVGGTPAGRLIHRESEQLFIGPYAIDADRAVRVIPPKVMPGRLTGIARHLTDPADKIHYATMEEGFYEVDVKSLAVKELYKDANDTKSKGGDLLPGYHGKGLFSGQGRLVYANNGELSPDALRMPEIASGCLAEWDGKDWTVVRRNQFTDVTGPGGILGNADAANDPLWSIGWDHRSLILMVRDDGRWHTYRLPKPSHCYDGAHGWNTEWPRIRDIGEKDLLMTMHGGFWRFPRNFSSKNSAGISMRSTYLKVIGDFARWNDRLVIGCDDAAKSEFLNKRKAKGTAAGPGRSQSNLWFVKPEQLDRLGPAVGRGAVWHRDAVKAGQPSDAYMFGGLSRRAAHLAHDAGQAVTFNLEIDETGNGAWRKFRDIEVPASGDLWIEFADADRAAWVRVTANADVPHATALFTNEGPDRRTTESAPMFDGLAKSDELEYSGGIVRPRGLTDMSLAFASSEVKDGKRVGEGYYEMGADLKLKRVENATDHDWLKKNCAVPTGVLEVDAASVIYRDEAGKRWRLPKGDAAFDADGPIPLRVCREAATERDVFDAHGTLYELPADNAGGFAKIRPIATHNRRIADFCSWRGMLVLTGIAANAPADNSHIIRSDDRKAAVWLGAIDDLWRLGKPVGRSGPWKDSAVNAGVPSDPYLFTGYGEKRIELSHSGKAPVRMRLEFDITGTGDWKSYFQIDVPAGGIKRHDFPREFAAYWVRVGAESNCTATATLIYE